MLFLCYTSQVSYRLLEAFSAEKALEIQTWWLGEADVCMSIISSSENTIILLRERSWKWHKASQSLAMRISAKPVAALRCTESAKTAPAARSVCRLRKQRQPKRAMAQATASAHLAGAWLPAPAPERNIRGVKASSMSSIWRFDSACYIKSRKCEESAADVNDSTYWLYDISVKYENEM